LGIVLANDVSAKEWYRLLAEAATATFFQTPAWSAVIAETIPGMSEAHLGVREDGRLVGVLPLIRRRALFLSTLESTSFGTPGGPVVAAGAPPDVGRALLEGFRRVAGGSLVGHAQLVDRNSEVDPGELPGFVQKRETAQVLTLDASYEELQGRFRPSARNKVRKARKAGVEVRRAEGEDDFLTYYAILEECRRRWGSGRGPGPAFFAGLSRLSRDSVEMWLAVHEGRVIGGDLNFVQGGIVMNWGNVSTDAARSLAPNNLLHAWAIERASEAGHRLYDLGSSAGIEGVRAFKASFGAAEVGYRRFVRERGWYRALRAVARR
jgi:CelD/BcsL family acetyltransferase involved in cellulose biosynthesis